MFFLPTIIFDSASPVIDTDVLTATAIKPYSKGKTARKFIWICITGGTIGTGKFQLRYGADVIADGLQSTHSTIGVYDMNLDIQPIEDGRWISDAAEVSLVVTEAPGTTLKFMIGLVEVVK